ncbi:MAG: hypothetical protein VKJ27_10615 [Synechocystis sp.]|nr:hypothetical protein [Synechocystis sp.]
MSTFPTSERKRLGMILLEAALITPAQLEVALNNQKHFDYLIGEVIALHGWVKKETIEFFAETWLELLAQSNPLPIGHYLQMASLLEPDQVEIILTEQKKMGLRFGAMAVLKGWIKQETMDYFLLNLKSDMSKRSGFQTHQISMETVEKYRQARKTRNKQTKAPHPTQGQGPRRSQSPTHPRGKNQIIISESTIELPPEFQGASIYHIDPHATEDENFDLASVLEMDEGNIC